DAFHNGAALLGGCCGTTPRHMKALKRLLEDCHE
ncbi:homocysteine S-methyltransferase family protein, partial [uncultured Treponema sp.]